MDLEDYLSETSIAFSALKYFAHLTYDKQRTNVGYLTNPKKNKVEGDILGISLAMILVLDYVGEMRKEFDKKVANYYRKVVDEDGEDLEE